MAVNETRRRGLLARAMAPVDAASLAVFRCAFGLLLAAELAIYWKNGWVNAHWISPSFHFKFWGCAWVEPWLGAYLNPFVLALICAAVGVATGFLYRITAWILWCGFTYLFLLDQAIYLNHFYLISLLAFLLAWIPTHRLWSLDTALGWTGTQPTIPASVLWLFQFQIAMPYVYGGIAKLNGDWLQGEPLRAWLAEQTALPVLGPYCTSEWLVWVFVWGGLLFDLLVVPLLLWHRTRILACLLTLCFHLTNATMFNIGVFPWLMLAATTLYLPPAWPRRFWRSQLAGNSASSLASCIDPARSGRVRLAALVIYVTLQLALPLRHFLYPGHVSWTKEGHRFAWHMMLNRYQGRAQFFVRERASGIAHEVDPFDDLSRKQWEVMLINPDMLLQYAQFLADKHRGSTGPAAMVTARVALSMDGRRPQWLIDPEIDLASQRRSLQHATWIVPLQHDLADRSQPGELEAMMPPSAIESYRRGRLLLADGHTAEAMTHLQQAAALDPNHVPARVLLGQELLRQHAAAAALPHLQVAWNRHTSWKGKVDGISLRKAFAHALTDTGQAHVAVTHWQAIRAESNDPEVCVGLGNALAASGRSAEAIEPFLDALQQSPRMSEARYNLGNAYLATGKYREAVDAYRITLQERPDFAAAHCNLGTAWHALRNMSEAIGCYHRALTLAPDLTDAHNNLGVALLAASRWSEAAAHFQQVLRLRPHDAAASANLAEARRHLPTSP